MRLIGRYFASKSKEMSKGEKTRLFIIEKSVPVFNVKGIGATSMSDIMAATKLSKGALYVHFKDKHDLVLSVVDYSIDLLGAKVMAEMGKVSTAKEKLFAFIDVLSDVLNPPVTGGCPMINFGMEADDTDPLVNKKVLQRMDDSQRIISNVIKQGIRSGEFKAGWNGREFATIMFAMVEGAVVIGRVARNNNKTKIVANKLKQMIEEQSL